MKHVFFFTDEQEVNVYFLSMVSLKIDALMTSKILNGTETFLVSLKYMLILVTFHVYLTLIKP